MPITISKTALSDSHLEDCIGHQATANILGSTTPFKSFSQPSRSDCLEIAIRLGCISTQRPNIEMEKGFDARSYLRIKDMLNRCSLRSTCNNTHIGSRLSKPMEILKKGKQDTTIHLARRPRGMLRWPRLLSPRFVRQELEPLKVWFKSNRGFPPPIT